MLITFNTYVNIKFSVEKRKLAIQKRHLFIKKFCDEINIEYIKNISNDKRNILLIYTINDYIHDKIDNEIAGIIIYKVIMNSKNLKRIYIPIISLKKGFRSMGYGELLFQNFVEKFNNNNIEFVLLSLPNSLNFYYKLGFIPSTIKYIENNEEIGKNVMLKFINKLV